MIMSAADFRKRKAFGRTTHKNPIAEDIETLLTAYASETSPNRKLKVVTLLYFLCLQYERGKFGDKVPPTKQQKSNLVLVLKSQIEAEIDSQAFKDQYAKKLAGEHYKKGVKQPDLPGGGTKLKATYGVETIIPQKNTIAKYELNTNIPAYGISLLSMDLESEFIAKGMSMDDAIKASHAKMAAMSMTDVFKEIHKMWKTQKDTAQFDFLDNASRQKYLLTFANGVWTCGQITPYNTPYPKMYVMDMAHQLYLPNNRGTGGGDFNHSSMLSGKPVLCAGELEITNNMITYIDNNSGHYKPDSNALKQVVQVLLREYHVPAQRLNWHDVVTKKRNGLDFCGKAQQTIAAPD